MLRINPTVLTDVAAENGWLHLTGRLAGTVNAAQMAQSLGVATTTVTRAYNGGSAGIALLEKLRDATGRSIDDFVQKTEDAA